jgi:hypothetical protein
MSFIHRSAVRHGGVAHIIVPLELNRSIKFLQ